jgi:hypothetical protein
MLKSINDCFGNLTHEGERADGEVQQGLGLKEGGVDTAGAVAFAQNVLGSML